MGLPSNVPRCFTLLMVIFFWKSQENYTNGFEQSNNSMVLINSIKYQNEMEPTRRNLHKNSIRINETQYESCINSTKNDCKNDSMQYESRGHIIKNWEENNQTSTESCANSAEINDSTFQEINENLTKNEGENNSTLYNDFYRISNTDNSMTTVVPYEECKNVSCIQLCCPLGNILTFTGDCVAGQGNYSFPDTYKYKNDSEDKKFDELFLTVRNPCVTNEVEPSLFDDRKYLFLVNGSLYKYSDELILPPSYCLAVIYRNVYDVIVCTNQIELPVHVSACLLVSLPFLLLTFIVYSVLPELQNIHGYTLRAHVASLFIAYAFMYFGPQIPGFALPSYICILLAYIYNFFLWSSFSWLNIICFDIWRTFRSFQSHRTNVKQDKKKFIRYSIYAWGIPAVVDVICTFFNYVPEIPKNYIQPEMCKRIFWYVDDVANPIYSYIPICATIIINIYFFVSTTLTIFYNDKHTALQLTDSGSKRHNENRQRMCMYLKLFVVMGASWIMEIISWTIDSVVIVPEYVWYPANMINSLQGLIIFIIFICRKRIIQLLLERFGRQNCGPFCKIPTKDDG